jgi:hypothetical protein
MLRAEKKIIPSIPRIQSPLSFFLNIILKFSLHHVIINIPSVNLQIFDISCNHTYCWVLNSFCLP